MKSGVIIFCLNHHHTIIVVLVVAVNCFASAQDGWLTVASFPGKEKLSFASQHDSILYAGTVTGLWRSSDEGYSWKQVLRGNAITALLATSGEAVLAGGAHYIYFSLDRGMHWDSVALDNQYPVHRIVSPAPGEFMLSTFGIGENTYEGDGIYYSSGDLKQWNKRNQGLPDAAPPTDQLLADRHGRVYVTIADGYQNGSGGLFYSDNKGLTWTKAMLNVSGLSSLRVEKSFGLSITPADSVLFSFTGASVNIAVGLNLIKHRDDIATSSQWRPMILRNVTNWWYDQVLNAVYVARNGTWYSSVTNTASLGGVWWSGNEGRTWQRLNAGTALAISTLFEERMFAENKHGRVFMVQQLDERIYYTDRSLLNPVRISGKIVDDQGKALGSVSLNNSIIPNLSTDPDGEFMMTVPRGWSGTITPSRMDYRFEPASITIDAIQQDINLSSIRATFTGKHVVWGFVTDVFGYPISDITVKGFEEEIITNANGSFSFGVDQGWTGIVSVAGDGWQFEPASVSVEPVFGNIYALQFTGMPAGHVVIKGSVNDPSGAPLPDAVLTGFPQLTRINDQGQFITTVPAGWSGRIAVSHPDFFFTPDHIDISNIGESLNGITFRGQVITGVDDDWVMFSAYPNPSANGSFSFRWPQQPAEGKVMISNLSGQTVYSGTLENFQLSETWQAPGRGIYLLTIVAGNKSMRHKLISN
ncbi:MAG: T9SS type A sorting domain-containing protein [Cyclobacteriaceae bacterium]|nr:T9SS type A sorting domain-containing protein [Cyclobacteriaceae bacterium]